MPTTSAASRFKPALARGQPPVRAVPPGDDIADWPDARIWEELQVRLGLDGWTLAEGEVLERA